MSDIRELQENELWNRCDPSIFEFETTASLPGDVTIIGQDRAVESIAFGIEIDAAGFNIYALGASGTGRATTIRSLLERAAALRPVPHDWIYVNNFLDTKRPRAIALPPGTAVPFARQMQDMVTDLQRDMPRTFESEDYEKQREAIVRRAQEMRGRTLAQLDQTVRAHGFALVQTAHGIGFAPVINGQVLDAEGYGQLDRQTQGEIEERQKQLQGEMSNAMRLVRDLDRDAKRRLTEFDRDVAGQVAGRVLEEIRTTYGHLPEISDYLAELQADVVDNVAALVAEVEDGQGKAGTARKEMLKRYDVNVIVDHGQQQGAPVIFETNPTYGNLVGRIEHRAEMGALVTDFTMIRAGALHRANGGYLVIEVDGLAGNPLAWEALKRALKNRVIRTEEVGAQMQIVSTVTIEPETIPLDVKVVLIGDAFTYYMLHGHEPDFAKLFKVQADFGASFPRTPETCQCYAHFIAARCRQEGLLPFDRQAVAAVVEFGSRLAAHQRRLSTHFGTIADLVREASFWAGKAGRKQVAAADVARADRERTRRANRVEDEVQELIDEGALRVDLTGHAIGQVNGLSVLSLGNHAFGRPSRITVRTYTGRQGVVSLDREAKLSGRIYDKGLLTLDGYLGGKYALSEPLSLSASISFEQLYEEVEGDSASCTELCALLSSLSELPLRQGLAVTGSVDQQGNVQPVGGVNEKVEGFFDTCRSRGLTGDQGVILPAQNVVNLMLRAEVREAVARGLFHIYPARTVDETIEILTGVPAGVAEAGGQYPGDTVHGRVAARLDVLGKNLKARDKQDEEDQDPPDPSSCQACH
jgi:lon-related putative ATP-dependent protease